MPEGTTLEQHRGGRARARPGGAHAAGGHRRPDLRRHLVAVQLQRPGAPLLPALGAAGGGPAGQPAAQARARPRPATRSPRSCATLLAPIGQRHGANVKVAEVPPGPPVLSTLVAEVYAPTLDQRVDARPQVRGIFECDARRGRRRLVRRGPRRRGSSCEVDREKAARAGVSPEVIVADAAGGLAGAEAGRLADSSAREDGAARAAARSRAALERSRSCSRSTSTAARGSSCRSARAGHAAAADGARAVHLPQEPAAGDLRPRRRRRRRGVAGLRASSPWASGSTRITDCRRPSARGALRRQPERRDALDADLGRRVADHLRGLPRHGDRLRRGAGADLLPGGRLVPLVRHAADHHGADPADADRHPAGARPRRRLLHRHLDDRLHRARRHHRPQLDPARRLHQSRARGRREARGGGDQGGGGALPADRPDRGGAGRGRRSSSCSTRSSRGWRWR